MPAFATPFLCVSSYNILSQRVELNSLQANLIKEYVDDFGPAIQISKIEGEGALKKNDVIISVDGERVKNILEFLAGMQKAKKNSAKLSIIRSKKKKSINVKLVSGLEIHKKNNVNVKKEYCVLKEKRYSDSRYYDEIIQECMDGRF